MDLAEKILNELPLTKPQRKFLLILFTTILVVRGKATFRNLSRYSRPSEQTYSRHFTQAVDFVAFNRQLIDATFGQDSERILAFDPTFIPKAGRHTFGRDHFWNGSKSRAEKGLELSTLAVVDLQHRQGLTLSARQTRPSTEETSTETLIDQYLERHCSVKIRVMRPLSIVQAPDKGSVVF
ncbi:MAG TPA: hypothetical protein EYQ18_12730 [Candidatus Handelsmanbacteria bacterium]|nr:hypothetical protein [Candidatus Handelsmanbacteria bacterium]